VSGTPKPLWSGRFATDVERRVLAFTSALQLDRRIALHDVRGSLAHVRMLRRQRILDQSEAKAIIEGLERIHTELEQGAFTWPADVEDIHTAVEHRLRELIGEAAGKLHTARSRNDQVALDLRLFTVASLEELDRAVLGLARALHERDSLIQVAPHAVDESQCECRGGDAVRRVQALCQS